jgi:hypothetical protein
VNFFIPFSSLLAFFSATGLSTRLGVSLGIYYHLQIPEASPWCMHNCVCLGIWRKNPQHKPQGTRPCCPEGAEKKKKSWRWGIAAVGRAGCWRGGWGWPFWGQPPLGVARGLGARKPPAPPPPPRAPPPLTFLERPPTARWAPASEALSVLAARGQHNGQHSPTWWGPAGA